MQLLNVIQTPVLKDTAQCVDLIRLGLAWCTWNNIGGWRGEKRNLVGYAWYQRPRTIFTPLKKTSLSKRQANKEVSPKPRWHNKKKHKIIYGFYSDLFDSHVRLPPHHLREDGQVIPEVLPSEVRHAIMSVRNRTAPGPDRIRPEHLKSLPPVLINTLARLFTRYLSECKVPKQWKISKTVLLYKKGDPHDIGNYRPICLLSVIYKVFTRVILNRNEKVLDEGQPCKQAGFREGFSTTDHIHTVSKLIEVSREYKMPLCLTFIDLKKAFDSVETEAVVEALDNQGVPTQYIKVLRELYSNFTTGISPFYKNIIIDVKRGVRQGDTISPKIFTATLENAMRKLEWDDIGVKVDGRQLHHLRFADDIVLITPSISQPERMLTEFDETCGCIGLQLNLQRCRELNMMNDLTPELGRRRRAAWGAYKSIEDVVKKTRNTRLRAHLFNTTVLPALTYASETWAFRKQEENAVSVIERAIERVMLGVSRSTQVKDGIRSSLLRQRSKIRDAAAFAKESKIRWARHVMRFNDNRWTRAVSNWVPRDIKRTTGRPPTQWSDFFTKSFKEKYDALRVPRERRNHWATLARDRDKWKNYWRPLDQFEDQRESRNYESAGALRASPQESGVVRVSGACSVLSDVIFVFGATKTDEQKEDTPLDEENVVQNRLGIACYLHMVASCFFVMGLLTAIASSYLLISSGKGREGCCQTKKDYLQQHRWNHESRTVFACSRKSCRPIVVIEDDSV
ncbi:hypothetical protein RB195_014925 [Necator americanus]|uniref:Reverse transcriptase domain-containing protein n=2 Tax=Necator americanus TaxID=51031 RepID=A0ABR1E2D5_NECAM